VGEEESVVVEYQQQHIINYAINLPVVASAIAGHRQQNQ
jgi:hypothetical protein